MFESESALTIDRLTAAIRKHRDQRGDDRCWLDDRELYAVLGEGEGNTALPPECEFIESCRRFWRQRQNPKHKRWEGLTIRELEEENAKLQEELGPRRIQFAVCHGPVLEQSFPTIVCLCGSTRFMEDFKKAEFDETLAGRIVLTIGCDSKSDSELFTGPDAADIKRRLDELHKRKIDLCDEVLILNVGGYIGESTRSELEYARVHSKVIRFLETPSSAIVRSFFGVQQPNLEEENTCLNKPAER